jgi:uncharacterized Tic20 family protein
MQTLAEAPPRAVHLAVASHLSAVAAALLAAAAAGGPEVWTGMAAFVGPLLVLHLAGRGDAFVRRHATAALCFNLSVAIYLGLILAGLRLATTGSVWTVQLTPFLLFVNILVAFNWLVFIAIGAQRAATGQLFTYPMTLPIPGRCT